MRKPLGPWGGGGDQAQFYVNDIEEAFSVYNLSHCLEGKRLGGGVREGRGTGLGMAQKGAEKRQLWP